MLLDIFRSLIDIRQSNINWLQPLPMECNNTDYANALPDTSFEILDHFRLTNFMTFATVNQFNQFDEDVPRIPPLTYVVNITITFYSSEHEAVTDLAVWQNGELKKQNQTISPAKRFFRIGTTEVTFRFSDKIFKHFKIICFN